MNKANKVLSDLKLTYKDVAKITGHSYGSIKTMLQPNKKLPRWFNLVIYIWEKSKKNSNLD